MKNERMYQELIELLTTDSAAGKENAIADKLTAKMEALGFTVTRDNAGETFGGECGNVIAVREGELKGSLFLSSHMDRVPNGLGIKPVEKDGVLYSDGTTILAADDISGVCAILEGLRQVLAAGTPLPRIEVVFSVGEETGLFGAKGRVHFCTAPCIDEELKAMDRSLPKTELFARVAALIDQNLVSQR